MPGGILKRFYDRIADTIVKLSFRHITILLLAHTSLLWADYIVPEICIYRMKQRQILTVPGSNGARPVPSESYEGLLNVNYTKRRDYHFGRIKQSLSETYRTWAEIIKTKNTSEMDFVYDCAQDPTQCVGLFDKTKPLHLNTYCDLTISKHLLEKIEEGARSILDRCVDRPEVYFSPQPSPQNTQIALVTENSDYQKKCTEENIADAKGKLSAVAKVAKDIQDAFLDFAETFEHKDILYFLIGKIHEEARLQANPDASQWQQRQRYAQFLSALIGGVKTPTEKQRNIKLQGIYAAADEFIRQDVGKIIAQDGELGVIFEPESPATHTWISERFTADLIFRDRATHHTRVDNTLVNNAALNRPVEYFLTHYQSPDPEAYQLMLRNFLPYQFLRVVRAKAVTFLQRMPQSEMHWHLPGPPSMNIFGSTPEYQEKLERFKRFAETAAGCDDVKENPQRAFFCSDELKPLREEKYAALFYDLAQGKIDLITNTSGYYRENIYADPKFQQNVNQNIQALNQMCYAFRAENHGEFDADTLKSNSAAHKKKIAAAFGTFLEQPGIAGLFENPIFLNKTQANFSQNFHNCTQWGFMFGSGLKPTATYQRILDTTKRNYGGDNVLPKGPLAFTDLYLPAPMSLSPADFSAIDAESERLIDEELALLETWASNLKENKLTSPDILDFMKQSAGERIFALMEFAVDYPSEQVGNLIRDALLGGNADQVKTDKILKAAQAFVLVATVASMGTLAVKAGAFYAILESGILMVGTAGQLGLLHIESIALKDRQSTITRAGLTDTFEDSKVIALQQAISQQIANNRLAMELTAVFAIGVDLIPVSRGVALMSKWLDRDFRLVFRKRINQMEGLMVKHEMVDLRWLGPRERAFLADPKNVPAKQFDLFLLNASDGHGSQYLAQHLPKFAERFPKAIRPEAKPVLARVFQCSIDVVSWPFKTLWHHTVARVWSKVSRWPTVSRALDWSEVSRLQALDAPAYQWLRRTGVRTLYYLKRHNYTDDRIFLQVLNTRLKKDWERLEKMIANDLRHLDVDEAADYPAAMRQKMHETIEDTWAREFAEYTYVRGLKKMVSTANDARIGQANEFLQQHIFEKLAKEYRIAGPRQQMMQENLDEYLQGPNGRGFRFSLDAETRIFVTEERIYLEVGTESAAKDGLGNSPSQYMFRGDTAVEDLNKELKLLQRDVTFIAGEVHVARMIAYLKPVLHGHLLDDTTWLKVFQTFDRPLRTIEDGKNFLKAVKFIARELPFWKSNITLGATADIIKGNLAVNINAFYDTAQYITAQRHLQFIQKLDQFVTLNKKDRNEIASVIKARHGYDVYAIKNRKGAYENIIDSFTLDKADVISRAQSYMIDVESKWVDLFFKRLESEYSRRYFRPGKTFEDAYTQALHRTQYTKGLTTECRLPSSAVRKGPNDLYKSFSKYISLTTNIGSYILTHQPEDAAGYLSMEYLTRLGFEAAVPYFTVPFKANLSVSARTNLERMGKEYFTNMGFGAIISGFYLGANTLLWQSEDLYEKQLAQTIAGISDPLYDPENGVAMRLEKLFEHAPKGALEQVEANLARLKKVWDEQVKTLTPENFATLEAQMATSEELYHTFMKANLIASLDLDDEENQFLKSQGYINAIETSDRFDDDVVMRTLEEDERHQKFEKLPLSKKEMGKMLYYDKYSVEPSVDPLSPLRGAKVYGHDLGGALKDVNSSFAVKQIKTAEALGPLDFAAESVDRFLFYSAWDLMFDSWISVGRNELIRATLCTTRRMPPLVGTISALAIYTVYKSIYDPIRYKVRLEATGR